MTAKELIKELQRIKPEDEVLVSGDSEGNEYRTIFELATWVRPDQSQYHVIVPTDDIIDVENNEK